jgi:RNA polymerase sigma factor (sigma-70 family)
MAVHPERLLRHLRRLVPRPSADRAADAALLETFVRHQTDEAFAALVGRHGPMVLGVCRRVLRDCHEAEDAAQATFLVLARKATTIRHPETLAAWLHRTAHNLAVKCRRGNTRRRQREMRSNPSPAPPDPLDEITARELLAIFDEELRRLPEGYRLPLILCGLEGRTQEEAARQLGWTPGALKGRLERGREKLHRRLAQRGLTLSAALAAAEAWRGVTAATPAGFLGPTFLAAATAAARTGVADGRIAPQVVALAEEGVRSVTLTKAKVFLALLLAVAGAGVGLLARQGPAAQPPEENRMATQQTPRADRLGDRLPEGALVRLGTLRWRAHGEVEALAFSPDGKTIAALSPRGIDRGLCLFERATARQVKHISPPDTYFWHIAFSPDGARLACSATVDKGDRSKSVVQIWEPSTARLVQEFVVGHAHWVGWSPAGQPLAVFLGEGEVLLRELATGTQRRLAAKGLPPSDRGLPSCTYAPAAKVLAVPDYNGVLHVWDAATGAERCAVQAKGSYVHGLALSPDGRSLASLARAGAENTVQLWDVATGTVTHTVATDQTYLHGVAFTPDGKTLATVGWWEVRFHDVATGRERGRTRGDKRSFAPAVAFAPDGKTLVTAEKYSDAVHLWDVATGVLLPEPAGHTNAPYQVAFSPDGRRVVTGGGQDGTLRVWDAASGAALTEVRLGEGVRACAFSADSRVLFSCSDGDQLRFHDAATGRLLHEMKLEDPQQPDADQAGMFMYLCDGGKTLVALSHYTARKGGEFIRAFLVTGWDTATRKQLFRRRRESVHFGVAVSADGKLLAVPQDDPSVKWSKEGAGFGLIRLEDLATGEYLLNLPGRGGQSHPLGFSPDGRLLVAQHFDFAGRPRPAGRGVECDHTLRVWEVATAGEVLALPSVLNARVAFSPDGRVLAVSSPSQQILLWDLRRGKELRRIRGFGAEVVSLAFSPDGSRLVSGLRDSTLLIWEGVPVRPPHKEEGLDDTGISRAWADLGADAPTAFAARGRLAQTPEKAVSVLRERLTPVPPTDAQRLRRLIADLDSDRFRVRQEARKALEEIAEPAAGALRRALAEKPSLEVRRQITGLLENLRGPITRPESLRALRGVAVLEDIGSTQAQQVLTTLAKGDPEARLTREAKASLERLARRAASHP